jgi:hypothetical protein
MAGIHPRYERLLETGLALAAEVSLPAALQRIVESAAELTGARPLRLHDIAEDPRSVGFRPTTRRCIRSSELRSPRGRVYGFDPAAATGTGQGLRNLRERAERLGGQADIHSIPGEGTRVRVTIPG